MLASTQGECAADSQVDDFSNQDVGNTGYLARHGRQMFEEGRSFSGNERDKLFFNRGDGTFLDLSDLSGCDSVGDGRASVSCDFDGDGDVDLFVHELQRERHRLYRNELGALYGSFLKLRLRATTGQWEAIGATVVVTSEAGTSALPLARGSGFVTSQAPELIFGLGPDSDEATVSVRWPGGGQDEYTLPANGRFELIEGGEARPFDAPRAQLPDPLPPGLKLQVGEIVPKLALRNSKDELAVLDPVALADGKPLYLNLWASYCGPCVAELPLLQAKHAAGEVRIVAISMDAPADHPKAVAALEAQSATFPTFYVGGEAPATGDVSPIEVLVDLERLPLPTTLVLDAEGRITEVIRGPLEE